MGRRVFLTLLFAAAVVGGGVVLGGYLLIQSLLAVERFVVNLPSLSAPVVEVDQYEGLVGEARLRAQLIDRVEGKIGRFLTQDEKMSFRTPSRQPYGYPAELQRAWKEYQDAYPDKLVTLSALDLQASPKVSTLARIRGGVNSLLSVGQSSPVVAGTSGGAATGQGIVLLGVSTPFLIFLLAIPVGGVSILGVLLALGHASGFIIEDKVKDSHGVTHIVRRSVGFIVWLADRLLNLGLGVVAAVTRPDSHEPRTSSSSIPVWTMLAWRIVVAGCTCGLAVLLLLLLRW